MQKIYPVRLSPGSTRKASRRIFGTGPLGGRSCQIETVDISEVELACAQKGFDLILPKIRIAYIDYRSQEPAHTTRPLIPGFAFIASPRSFSELEAVKGIGHVLRSNGQPMAMSASDMHDLKTAQTIATIEFHSAWAQMNAKRMKLSRADMRREFKKGQRIRITNGVVPGYATIQDVTTRKTVKVIHETLQAKLELPLDAFEMDAYIAA